MRWFGEPWPAADMRASVCEDDADQVPTPVGELCAGCPTPIEPDARGVVVPYVRSGADAAVPTPYHLRCFMGMVLPPELVRVINKNGRLW